MPVPSPSDAVPLLQQLLRINSVNPDMEEGAPGESAIIDWCATWLADHGFEIERLEATEGRPSLVATASGSGGGPSLMLNAHVDTVSVAGYLGDPFSGEVRGGEVHGRGAFDTKGGAAAIMVAAARAVAAQPAGDVIVTLVADEEFASIGTDEVLRHARADAAVIVEPSNLDLVVAHRGFAWFELELTGRAAHSSMPHQGVDAIAHAGAVMNAIYELRARLTETEQHPLLGHGTLQVSTISGGRDAATVPPSCTMTIERRFLPGQTPDSVEAELRYLLDGVAARTPDFDYTLTRIVARGAFEADPDWPIVRALADASGAVRGAPARMRGEPFWTDAGLVLEAGIPCLLIGVDGGGAHADTEWATVDSVVELTEILERTIVTFCGSAPHSAA